jgi:hypothetical protein
VYVAKDIYCVRGLFLLYRERVYIPLKIIV